MFLRKTWGRCSTCDKKLYHIRTETTKEYEDVSINVQRETGRSRKTEVYKCENPKCPNDHELSKVID